MPYKHWESSVGHSTMSKAFPCSVADLPERGAAAVEEKTVKTSGGKDSRTEGETHA